MPAGTTCSVHPETPAIRLCSICSSPICQTCEFLFPGNLHLCTTCATKPRDVKLSPGRRRNLVIAYICVIWATLATVLLFTAGAIIDDEKILLAIENLFGFAVLIPSIIGTALAFAVLDKRLTNPLAVWIAVVWNSLYIFFLIILTCVGIFME